MRGALWRRDTKHSHSKSGELHRHSQTLHLTSINSNDPAFGRAENHAFPEERMCTPGSKLIEEAPSELEVSPSGKEGFYKNEFSPVRVTPFALDEPTGPQCKSI